MATRDWVNSSNFVTGFTALTAGDVLRMGDGDGLVSAGLANSGTDILSLEIYASNRNSIGSSAQPLEIVVNQTGTGFFRWGGGGSELWLSGGSVANVVHRVTLAPTQNGRGVLRAMDCEELVVESGVHTVEANADVAAAYIFGGDTTIVAASGGASALTSLFVYAGVCRLYRDLSGTIVVGAGARLYVEDVLVVPAQLDQHGGVVHWKGGNIPIVRGYAGEFDRTNATKPATFGGTSYRAGPGWTRRDPRIAVDTWSNAVAIGTGPSVVAMA